MSTTPTLQPQFATIAVWKQLSGMGRSRTYQELAVGHLRGKKCGTRTLIDVPHGLAYLRTLPDAKIRPPTSPARSTILA